LAFFSPILSDLKASRSPRRSAPFNDTCSAPTVRKSLPSIPERLVFIMSLSSKYLVYSNFSVLLAIILSAKDLAKASYYLLKLVSNNVFSLFMCLFIFSTNIVNFS
jgi:hypothetical protein